MPNPSTVPTGPIVTDSNRKGDIFEYHVALEAWKRGAEVYFNAGCTGSTDLILEKNNRILKCDVKSMFKDKGRYRPHGNDKIAEGVTQIAVHPETMAIQWVTKFTPEGWEEFWA